MARNNDDGASQEQPNDSRIEELQSQLQEQRIEMAQMREQVTALTRMMGSLMDMVQRCNASAVSSLPVIGENNHRVIPGRDVISASEVKATPCHGIKGKGKEPIKLAQGNNHSGSTSKVNHYETSQKGPNPTNSQVSRRQRRVEEFKRPIPDVGLSRSELFQRLWALGRIGPKPGKILTAPFPSWYQADLSCEYHMNMPGHSIDTCDAFRRHVWTLIDAEMFYPSLIPSETEKEQGSDPFPDYGMSCDELFKRLCEKGLMHPTSRPVKEYTAPFPPWYKADLTCEYHMNAPGHSIEMRAIFKRHVLSLVKAKVINEQGLNIFK